MEYLNGAFILEFTDSTVGCGRKIRRAKLERCRKIHILADTSSLEIYLDHGEKVLSTRFYPDDTEVMLTCSGLSGNVFQLNEMEVRSDG
jgi:beta-fructofuranosidase